MSLLVNAMVNSGTGPHINLPFLAFALPGVDVHTKGGYQYPISQVTLVQYSNNTFQPVGKLINGRGA